MPIPWEGLCLIVHLNLSRSLMVGQERMAVLVKLRWEDPRSGDWGEQIDKPIATKAGGSSSQ